MALFSSSAFLYPHKGDILNFLHVISEKWISITYGMKTTHAYEQIKVSHIINFVFLVHIFATLVAILSEVHCKGYIHVDVNM